MSNIVNLYKETNKTYSDIKVGDTVIILGLTNEAVKGRWSKNKSYTVLESYSCKAKHGNELLCNEYECSTKYHAVICKCDVPFGVNKRETATMCGCILGDINRVAYK